MLATIDIWAEFSEIIRTKRMQSFGGEHVVPLFTPYVDKFVLFDLSHIAKSYELPSSLVGAPLQFVAPSPKTALIFANDSMAELGLIECVAEGELNVYGFGYSGKRNKFGLWGECKTLVSRFEGHAWKDEEFASKQINVFLTWSTLITNRDVEYVYDAGGTATKRINARRERLNLPTIQPIKKIIHLTERKVIRPVEGIGAGSETHGTRGPYDFVKAEWQVVRTTRSGRTVEYTARRKPELLNRKKTTYFEVRP